MGFRFFFPLVFILTLCPRSSGSSGLLLSHFTVSIFWGGGTHTRRASGQANKPPLHRCTSWLQCLGSVWLGGWWDRGTALRSPPLWAPSAGFGKKSDTCCLLLEAVCGSPLREGSRGRHLQLVRGVSLICCFSLQLIKIKQCAEVGEYRGGKRWRLRMSLRWPPRASCPQSLKRP